MSLAVIILAGGKGSRFRSARPKVVHEVCGMPVVCHVIDTVKTLRAQRYFLVVSPRIRQQVAEILSETGGKIELVEQAQPLGTGHAVMTAMKELKGFTGQILIVPGDAPLLCSNSLKKIVSSMTDDGPGSILTTMRSDHNNFGRVVRGIDGRINSITEARDADAVTLAIREVNTGVYCCDADWLQSNLKRVGRDNAQDEYYLTDLANIAAREGSGFIPVLADDATEFLGINTRADLARVSEVLRHRLVDKWMELGVTFENPETVQLDSGVQIGQDTVIGPLVSLRGDTRIGAGCAIGQGAIITDCKIAAGVEIKPYSVLDAAQIASECVVGPFARLRAGAHLDRAARVGNFVEVKKSRLGEGVKVGHLTYLGDASVGSGTNVGCGTITCNYDGSEKHRTTIGRDVFVGSDVQFIAPVKVGSGATIAAGSVVTDSVPANALALARSRQVNKRGWKKSRESTPKGSKKK